jgi:hypothetical protein
MHWVRPALDLNQWRAVVNTNESVLKKKVGKFMSGWVTVGFLRRTRLHGVSGLVS